MNRLSPGRLTLARVFAVLLAAVLVAGLITGCGDDESTETSFTVSETQDTFKVNDVPPLARGGEDLSPGDSFLITADLTGEREGRAVIQCTSASEQFEVVCQITYKFEDGDIVLAGSPDLAAEEETPFQVAVTGGTGAYQGASGSMTATQVEGKDVQSDEFELRLPGE